MTATTCTCPEDNWRGLRGHINLTMNGAWPGGDDEHQLTCHICEGVVARRYADPDKPAMDHQPLYTSATAWYQALSQGVGYRLTPDQIQAAGRKARADEKSQAALEEAAREARLNPFG